MGDQNQDQDQGLEFLDIGIEVKEFVREDSRDSDIRQRLEEKEHTGRPQMNRLMSLVILLAAVLCAALCGLLWLKVPPAAVLLVIILEEALAVCLRNAKIWLHLIVVAGNIVLGIIFGMTVFLLLASLVYLAEIVTAHYRNKI